MSKKKLLGFSIVAGLLVLAVTLPAAELALRLTGSTPWESGERIENQPSTTRPDPELGWRYIPGRYTMPPFVDAGEPTTLTIGPDGYRVTGDAPKGQTARVVLIGGSYTFGHGLSDDQTLAWRLQHDIPEAAVANLGAVGYGTYQSLLTLEKYLASTPESEAPLKLVIYGFIQHHRERNVAGWVWLRTMSMNAQQRDVRVPFCTLDTAGRLQPQAPDGYPVWWFRESSALVTRLSELHARLRGRGRYGQMEGVTRAVLQRINQLCKDRGAAFIVASFDVTSEVKSEYAAFLAENGIEHVDCVHPRRGDMDLRLIGDHHPNHIVNEYWAETLLPIVRSRVTPQP